MHSVDMLGGLPFKGKVSILGKSKVASEECILCVVLVVENDGLTAHDVAYVIRDLKSDVAGIATTSADALDMIRIRAH